MVTRPVRRDCERAEGGGTLALPGEVHIPCSYCIPGNGGKMEDCSQNIVY